MKNKTTDFQAAVMGIIIVIGFMLLGLIEEVPV